MARQAIIWILPVSIGVAVYLYLIDDSKPELPELKPVTSLEWNHEAGFADKIARGRVPTVFTGSPFLAWPAANWTPSYLATTVPFVLTKRSSKSIFKYFSKNKPLAAVVEVSKDYTEVIKSGREFITSITTASEENFYYASGPAEQLDLPSDVAETDSLTVHDLGNSSSTGTVNFWIGSRSVTAHMHYDTSHNFHAVVYGRKRFLLMPPSANQELKLYPCIHPYYRQAKVNISYVAIGSDSTTKTSSLQEVVLHPGDTLYIPPYWFHQVTSEDVTISLNVWSPSREYAAMETVYNSHIPLDSKWNQCQLLAASAFYIDSLLQQLEVYLQVNPQKFLQSLYQQRYAEVFAKPECDGGPCPKRQVPDHSISYENLSVQAAEVAKILIKSHELDSQILEINVANFIEHLVSRVLGEDDLFQIPCVFQSYLTL